MDELTALTVFNINGKDVNSIQEIYEEVCFETKSYFLKNAAIPKLVISKLSRLRDYEEARCRLTEKEFLFQEIKMERPSGNNYDNYSWAVFFEEYNSQVASIRLSLSKAKNGNEIASQLLLLGETELLFYSIWLDVFKEVNDDTIMLAADKQAKISAARNTVSLLNSLDTIFGDETIQGSKNKMNGDYLMSLRDKIELRPSLSEIMTELFRIKKLSSQP